MKRKRAHITPTGWTRNEWHGTAGFTRWRVTPTGVIREGSTAPRYPKWAPVVGHARKAFDLYGDQVSSIAKIWSPYVDARTLIATICCESGVDPTASRYEQAHDDRSFGLCQILTSVAWQIGRRIGWPLASEIGGSTHGMPGKPTSLGGRTNLVAWHEWLADPWVNIALCAALHTINDDRLDLKSDPMLQYVAYNTGGVYVGRTRFGLHYHPSALESFEMFYNDAARIF